MASWQQFESDVPEFAARVRGSLDAHKHKTMATLRKDGSPRISGTELDFKEGQVWLGSMPGALKALDLRRDPRVAVHSGSVDPDLDDPTAWPGDAKIAGRAVEVTDPEVLRRFESPAGEFHLFRIDLAEVVRTYVGPGADGGEPDLVVEMWHEDGGYREVRRK
jgi:hypothetical protein